MREITATPPARATSLLTALLVASAPFAANAAEARFEFLGAGYLSFPDAPGPATGADVGDLNGDGVPDALASFKGDPPTLRVYAADAPLVFREVGRVQAPIAGRVILADVTGDGVQDALIHEFGNATPDSRLAVFRGESEATFELAAIVYTSTSSSYTPDFLFTDLDGDGHTDILLAGQSALILYGPDWSPPERIPTPQGELAGLTVYDFDSDGRNDILLSLLGSPRFFHLFLQLPDRQLIPFTILDGGYGPFHLVDTDRDGRLEVLGVAPNALSAYSIDRSGGDWKTTVRTLEANAIDLRWHAFVDLDLDGLVDAFAVYSSGCECGATFWGESSQNGLVLRGGSRVTALPGVPTKPVEARDLNGDGLPDLLLSTLNSFGTTYILGEGRRGLRQAQRLGDYQERTPVSNVDIDGDGYDDLVMVVGDGIEFRLGSEQGLGLAVPADLMGRAVSIAAGRLQPEGPPLLFTGDAQRLRWAEMSVGGVGNWNFLAEADFGFAELEHIPVKEGQTAGILALKSRLGQDPSQTIARYQADGASGLEKSWEVSVSPTSANPRAADLDGDGFEDLVYATAGGAVLAPGSRNGPRAYTETATIAWHDIRSTAALDVEGDGFYEAVVARPDGPVGGILLLKRGAEGTWTAKPLSDIKTLSLRAADLDRDGRTDLAATTQLGFKVFYNLESESLEEFGPRILAEGGSGLRVADLNADGSADLLSHSYYDLAIVYGNAAGKFEGLLDIGRVFSDPIRALSGDFNGDGTFDLLFILGFGSNVVFLTGVGETPGSLVELSGPMEDADIAATGDFDGDGKFDLVGLPSPPLLFARGSTSATFSEAVPLAQLEIGTGLDGGDIDEDGIDDLVVAGSTVGLQFLMGGAGFESRSPVILPMEARAGGLRLMDLNGDAHLDIVFSVFDSGETTYWTLPGSGDGSFATAIPTPAMDLARPDDMLADIDGDGLPDTLGTDDQGNLFPLFGDGQFGFAPGQPLGVRGFQGTFYELGLTDLDGDSIVDIFGIGDGLFVLKGLGQGRFDKARFFSGKFFAAHDVDGDGLKDLLTSHTSDSRTYVEAILASRESLLAAGRRHTIQPMAFCAGNLDGDTAAELAVVSRQGTIVILDPNARDLTTAAVLPLDEIDEDDGVHIEASDIDGDGMVDLAMLWNNKLRWRRNAGGYEFEEERVLINDLEEGELTFLDLDRDGHDDLLISGFTVARGLGQATFGPPMDFRTQEGPLPNSSVLDFNGDGIWDVLHAPQRGGTVFFSAGMGDGRFEAAVFLPSGERETGGLALGDFNGDGRIDVAQGGVGEEPKLAPRVWYTQPDASLVRGSDLVDPFGQDDGTRALVAVDLDGDGIDDLLSSDPEGRVLAYLGGPDGVSQPIAATYGPDSPGFLLAGNFTGDFAADVISGGDDGIFVTAGLRSGAAFLRGDANADGELNISDPIQLLNWLYLGSGLIPCNDAADANDDGKLNISDPIYIFQYKFASGMPPPAPFPLCGVEETLDSLACSSHPPCV